MANLNREYDVHNAARELGVSEVTMRRLVARREIGHYRKGTGRGLIVVTQNDLESYRKARTVVPVAA